MNFELTTSRIKEGIEALSPFTATPGKGTTRLPFTPEARSCANHIKTMMEQAGLKVHEDAVGNVFGVLEGEDPDAPVIMTGSHFDTVVNGGDFDGLAGIITGLEICRLVRENNVKLKRNLVVAAFNDEEGMRFGTGYFGSKSMLGQMTLEDLHSFKDKDDISIYTAMQGYGLVPEKLGEAKQDIKKIKAFIEMHIEQGPVLYQRGIELGLVECIVGIQRYIITVTGRADHAGTTPMDMRIDAVEAATKVVSKIPDWAREEGNGTVATTGFMKVLPGGMNIVAEEVQFSVDIRSSDVTHISKIVTKMRAELEAVEKETGVTCHVDKKLTITPVSLCNSMINLMQKSCEANNFSYLRLNSGAGHDSLAIGQALDTVMIFVPSKDGRSHCPVEWSEYDHIAKAVAVVYDLVLEMQKL